MTPSTLIAVADAHTLRLSDGRTFPRRHAMHTPEHLLATCKYLYITDLYLHPSAPECAWDLWKKGDSPWIHPTPYDAWIVSTAAETRAPWREAPDGLTLLAAVQAFRDALKCDYYRSPGSTGLRLLRGVHTGPHALALDLPAKPPPPAREVTEGDLVWMRNLVGDEPTRRYLHTYDRNASYLAACSSLPLGVGAAEHVESAGLTDGDTHLPGYFRVHIPPAWKWLGEYDDGIAQPPPCHIDAKGRQVWITTPTYRLLDELGAGPCITEAWLWQKPNVHRVLEPWYKQLRDARLRLMQRGTPAERIALGVLKEVYVQAISWFTSELWERDSDPLYRPDWRHQIIALARANTYRVIRDCYEEGRPPFACATDELFFLSDDPDPLTAAPRAIRCNPRTGEPRMSYRLGHWKVKHSAPMAEIAHVWGHSAFRLGTLTTALKEREQQKGA